MEALLELTPNSTRIVIPNIVTMTGTMIDMMMDMSGIAIS